MSRWIENHPWTLAYIAVIGTVNLLLNILHVLH